MKIEKYGFILVVLTGILSIAALGEIELPEAVDRPFLIGQAYPELVGIKGLNVAIVPTYMDPNEVDLVFKELPQKIVKKLQKADISAAPMFNGKISVFSYDAPDLRVYISILKFLDSQKYVVCVQTALARAVTLLGQHKSFFKADVWKTEPIMRVATVQSMSVKVTDVVLEQIDAFICAYHVANPPVVQPSEGDDTSTISLTTPKSEYHTTQASVQYNYVASKNSKVFHKPNCRWAKNILPNNLVSYNSRDEAIEAGQKPFKSCKP